MSNFTFPLNLIPPMVLAEARVGDTSETEEEIAMAELVDRVADVIYEAAVANAEKGQSCSRVMAEAAARAAIDVILERA